MLQTCLKHGIYIPNLCFLEQMPEAPSSCRLCFVEIQGEPDPIPSCTVRIRPGMEVRTDTDAVRGLQRRAFQLLMSTHEVDCGNCPANRQCELQRIAKHLKVGLKSGSLEKKLKALDQDSEPPLISCYPNRCVLCGKCIFICKEKHGQPMMSFVKRGLETFISFYGTGPETQDGLSEEICGKCGDCVKICPVKALVLNESSAP